MGRHTLEGCNAFGSRRRCVHCVPKLPEVCAQEVKEVDIVVNDENT